MAKISKRLLKYHNEAVELLKNDSLTHNQRQFVFDNYHEGAGKMNNLISAHFTPHNLARHINMCARYDNFVDLCAGIGMLAYAKLRDWEIGSVSSDPIPFGVCVENCTEYYEVGKKLLPQFHWINGDIFDPKVIAEVKRLMKGKRFSIISNPPYGKQVKTETKGVLKYTGSIFEYKAVELGAVLGAEDGAFLLPQTSCPFRLSGQRNWMIEDERYKTPDYLKFVKQTGLELNPNMGIDTLGCLTEGSNWKDVSITTEIAEIDYSELEYSPIFKKVEESQEPEEFQTTLF